MTDNPWPNADLEQWLRDHPLPEGVEDTELNMREAGQMFSVSSNAIKEWLSSPTDPMPYVETGGHGREYKLRLSWSYAWREKRAAAKTARAKRLANLQASLFPVPNEPEEETLSLFQVREASKTALEYAKAERELRRLASMTEVFALLERLLVLFRDAAMGMPDRLERELTLTPPQTRMVERAMEEVLQSLQVEIQEDVLGTDFVADLDMEPQLTVAS